MTMKIDEVKTPNQQANQQTQEPRGFGEHSRGLAGEYAHEQGWGLNEPERTTELAGADGGADYEYGAQDFGDEAVDTSAAKPTAANLNNILKD